MNNENEQPKTAPVDTVEPVVGCQIQTGDKVSLNMSGIAQLHCEVYSESDDEVLLAFWIPKVNLSPNARSERTGEGA